MIILLIITWYIIGFATSVIYHYRDNDKYITIGELLISLIFGIGGVIVPLVISVVLIENSDFMSRKLFK